MSRVARSTMTILLVAVVGLVVLSTAWGGWSGKAAFLLALVLLVIAGIAALICHARRRSRLPKTGIFERRLGETFGHLLAGVA